MTGCVFCDIVTGQAPASFVYRDDRVTAFLDNRPVTPGHLLVIPNDHLETMADLDDGLLSDITRVGARLAAALRSSGLPCEGINLFLADGAAAGQEVLHAHLHVFPRTPGDGFTVGATAWAGPQPDRRALDAVADVIRSAAAENV
jgi:diadenosine tetraphosphate (Ap4A) HIT family hydrolase